MNKNNEIILDLQQKVEDMGTTVNSMQKSVNALKINDQRRLSSNNPIPPGIACKVSYDTNGLIIKGIGLDVSDIPQLGIDKIINLKQSLDSKASNKDLESFKKSVTDMIKPTMDNLGKIVGTGIKVNYNSDGRIVSTVDLLPSDIPTLPITKIDGLEDIIKLFNSIKTESVDNKDIHDIKVTPGMFAKVNVDQHGRVVSGDKLNMNDIPTELISKINILESKIPSLASQHSIDAINNELGDKLTANKPIASGTYTKVKVDSKGLVVNGDKLTVRDLPELSISDIAGLDRALLSKAGQNDFITLSDTVSSIVNSLSSIGEINGIKNELKSKASDEEVKMIRSKLTSIQNTVDSLVNRMPSDMIMEQLMQITNELSTISGRVSVIEQKLSL